MEWGVSGTSRVTPELSLLTVKLSRRLQAYDPCFPKKETEATEWKYFCSGPPAELQP